MVDQRFRVIVIDDDRGFRLTLQGIMEDEGYEVVSAGDGQGAIALAKEWSFDLAFIDIKMPGLSGVEVFRQIKEISPNTIVVMMTGFASEELTKEAMEVGAQAVLFKPFDIEKVLSMVQAVLRSSKDQECLRPSFSALSVELPITSPSPPSPGRA